MNTSLKMYSRMLYDLSTGLLHGLRNGSINNVRTLVCSDEHFSRYHQVIVTFGIIFLRF